MPDTVTPDLIYEVLKKLQSGMARIENRLEDHTRQFIGLREQLHPSRAIRYGKSGL